MCLLGGGGLGAVLKRRGDWREEEKEGREEVEVNR